MKRPHSICTKTGDGGKTDILYGRRVSKDNLRIEACGALDELNSFLGLCKNLLKDKASKKLINKVQRDLFVIGSEVACRKASFYKLKKKINNQDIRLLELFIERLEKKHKIKRFVTPGENTLSALVDIARTVARRAERRIVTLKNKKKLQDRYVLIYLNRLSDLLFLLARSCVKKS